MLQQHDRLCREGHRPTRVVRPRDTMLGERLANLRRPPHEPLLNRRPEGPPAALEHEQADQQRDQRDRDREPAWLFIPHWGSVLEFYLDFSVGYSYGVRVDIPGRRRSEHQTIAKPELCRVPRTGDDPILTGSLGQRPTSVGARIVHGVEGPAVVEEGDPLVAGGDHLSLPWPKVAGLGHLDSLC